jgi:hypothetical protein
LKGDDGGIMETNSKKIVSINFFHNFAFYCISFFSCSVKGNLDLNPPFLSRLETRTKEYNIGARVKEIYKTDTLNESEE